MRKGNRLFLLAIAVASGLAWQASAADTVGYEAMRAKDWPTAERQLLAGLQQNPRDVFQQLNLAWVYAQTGRKEQAAGIYRSIIASEDRRVAELSSGEPAPVRALAQRGLDLLNR